MTPHNIFDSHTIMIMIGQWYYCTGHFTWPSSVAVNSHQVAAGSSCQMALLAWGPQSGQLQIDPLVIYPRVN